MLRATTSALRVILGVLMIAAFMSPALAISQSAFRFKKKPEFMLLSVHRTPELLGFTASLWEQSYESVIVGRHLPDGSIELSFYPPVVYVLALKAASRTKAWSDCKPANRQWPTLFDGDEWNPERPDLSKAECFNTIAKLIPQMGVAPFQKGVFAFVARHQEYDDSGHIPGEWIVKDKPNFPEEYSSFAFEKDYGLLSAQRELRGERFQLAKPFRSTTPRALDNLWLDKIFPFEGGGLAPVRTDVIKTNCKDTDANLRPYLIAAGKWDVQVEPDSWATYRIQLKSHSDREFFYRDGYWWKAYVLIEFWSNDGRTCSRAQIYLYDSVVCGGPINDDPERSGRKQCFQRTDPDSKAESDLRDRLRLIIQKAYGAPN